MTEFEEYGYPIQLFWPTFIRIPHIGPGVMVESQLIVKAAVKEELANHNVSSDFYEELDREIEEILDDAATRARENDRKTVQSRDL